MENIINKSFVRLIPPSGFGSTDAAKLHTLSFSKREKFKVFICKCESKSDGNLAVVHTNSDEKEKENENISDEPKINSLIEPWMLRWTVPSDEPKINSLIEPWMLRWTVPSEIPPTEPPKEDEQAQLSSNPFTKQLLETEALEDVQKSNQESDKLRKHRDQTLFLGETYNLNGEVATVVELLEDMTMIIGPNLRPKPLFNTTLADKNFKVENISRAKAHIIEGAFFISLTNEEVGHDICLDIEIMLASNPYDYAKLGQVPHLAPSSWPDFSKGKVKIMYRCYVKKVDQYTLMNMKSEMFRRAIRLTKLHGGKIILEKVQLLSGPTVL